MTERLKKLGELWLRHEGPAWTATAAWLVLVTAGIVWKGAVYDESVRLDLADWSDVGTFVSAVVAPIAVLWIVRSFYVQKRELAEAVRAASLQAAALQEQNVLLREDRERASTPRLILGVRSSVVKNVARMFEAQAHDQFREEFEFRLRNTGHGTAYEVAMTVWGVIAQNVDHWVDESSVLQEVMGTDSGADYRVSRLLNAAVGQSVNLLITISYRHMDRSLGRQFFLYNCVTDVVDETTHQRFDALVAAGGHIPES